MDVRQRIGDMLNRVALRHDEFIIEGKGKSLAALVPVERLEQMRRFVRRHTPSSSGITRRQREAVGSQFVRVSPQDQVHGDPRRSRREHLHQRSRAP